MSKAEESAEKKADPLHEARERFKIAKEAWDEDRKRYVDDLKFSNGDHWPDAIKKLRDKDNRPCLVVDKLNQYIRQVVNDSRQNRPSIKVRPVDNDADIETAEIYQGLVRHIEERSNADTAYDTALECAVKGGFGFFRVLTEYAHENTFDQEICLKRVRNPLTVYLDPGCQEPDGSDAKWGFVAEEIPEDEYEARWPNAEKVDWDTDETLREWYGEEKVIVAEYWEIVETPQTVHLLADGTTCPDSEYQKAIDEGIQPPEIVDSREIPVKSLKWSRINGKEYLEGPEDRPGKWIPIIPVWGNESDVDGKVIHTSMIHSSKDAQRLYNFSRSAFAERVALTPKAPYVAAVGATENFEDEWEQANTANLSVLHFNHVDESGNPIPTPTRQQASDIPAGFAQDMQMSEHDIQGSLGMYNASLGQQSNEKSGRAILARQKEGDITNFHYHDNLARAIRHAGRIIVDLIPKIYDSTRVVRVLGLDGTADMVELDPTLPVASAKMNGKQVYNLGVGTYDVAVSAGPSYTTRRQEAADSMVQLTQGNPALFPLIGDLMIRSMDWPQAEEIADRLKLMLPPQILEAEKKEEGGPSPEVQAIMQQAQQAMAQKDELMQGAVQEIERLRQATEDMQKEVAEKMKELEIKEREVGIKEYEAETKRAQVLAPALDAQQIQMLVLQTMQDLMTQQSEPIAPPEQYSMPMVPTDDAPEMMGGIPQEPIPQGF